MSYILESIKQAERERKIGQAPSISVQYSAHQENIADSNWMKLFIMSLIVIATAFIVWQGMRIFADIRTQQVQENGQINSIENMHDSASLANHVQTVKNQELATHSEKIDKTRNVESNTTLMQVNEEKNQITFISNEALHHSKLKSIEAIVEHEHEHEMIVQEKSSEQNLENNVEKSQPEEVFDNQIHQQLISNASEKANEITDQLDPKEKLYSLYSELASSAEESIIDLEKTPVTDHVEWSNEVSYVSVPNYTNEVEPDSAQPIISAVSTGIPSVGELPYELQEDIPDISISVHMFNENPALRKIRINGRMYTEGKSLQSDLALVEITRYGAIFDYQGHAFRLNVR